jgi:hypothetical protein
MRHDLNLFSFRTGGHYYFDLELSFSQNGPSGREYFINLHGKRFEVPLSVFRASYGNHELWRDATQWLSDRTGEDGEVLLAAVMICNGRAEELPELPRDTLDKAKAIAREAVLASTFPRVTTDYVNQV